MIFAPHSQRHHNNRRWKFDRVPTLLVSDFDYELPEELIATEPAAERDASRLLVVQAGAPLAHRQFSDIGEYLRAGDLLVLNDSRVIPSRLLGTRPGGGASEALLLEEVSNTPPRWNAFVRPGRKLREGARIIFAPGEFEAEVESVNEDGSRVLRFEGTAPMREMLERHALMPLPPYIIKAREVRSPTTQTDVWRELDRHRYQTVYAKTEGSVAAPTAGLHFTAELLAALANRGIESARVTLHVGAGTFKPMEDGRVEDHAMHSERWEVSDESAARISEVKRAGGRIVAVGTTSVRVLESASDESGNLRAGSGDTRLLISPGYKFRMVDAMITNFHLPKSTLLLLVSAFAGREEILGAYDVAVRERYRFYSYGDAMFLERKTI